MKKTIISLLLIIFFMAILSIDKLGIFSSNKLASLYSWNLDLVTEDEDKFYDVLKEYKIGILYQDFSTDFLEDDDDSFIRDMSSFGIEVYHLNGDPSWGTKGGAKRIKKEIDRVSDFNDQTEYKIKGILLDIEPYISEREEKFDEDDFEIYVEEIEKSYQYSKERDVEFIIAIPYWFDSISSSLLERLIQSTDGISVMNYHIDKTIKNIETEVELARKYKKKIDSIYEIKYEDEESFGSKDEIVQDFKEMEEHFSYDLLKISYHHYGAIE